MKTGYSTNDHTFAICAYGESPYLDQCVQSLFDQDKASRVVIFTSTPKALMAHRIYEGSVTGKLIKTESGQKSRLES